MAGKRDITINKGDDYSHVITFNTRVAGVLTPTNITGRTYVAQIRARSVDTAVIASFVCTVAAGTGGVLTLTMANAITAALTVGCYYWELRQTTSGIVNTVLKGEAKVEA